MVIKDYMRVFVEIPNNLGLSISPMHVLDQLVPNECFPLRYLRTYRALYLTNPPGANMIITLLLVTSCISPFLAFTKYESGIQIRSFTWLLRYNVWLVPWSSLLSIHCCLKKTSNVKSCAKCWKRTRKKETRNTFTVSALSLGQFTPLIFDTLFVVMICYATIKSRICNKQGSCHTRDATPNHLGKRRRFTKGKRPRAMRHALRPRLHYAEEFENGGFTSYILENW